jgi:uncharacterized protein involved in exopolysaccharide biosynthesis
MLTNINNHQAEIIKKKTSMQSIINYNERLNTQIKLLQTKKDNMEVDNEKLNELKVKLVELNKAQEDISTERHYYDFASSLLKDTGIKTKIIKQYLPVNEQVD